VSIRVHLWFLQPQSRRCPKAQRRGQPLHSQARNAKNAPESAICGVLPNRPTPTGSVLWLVPISNPTSAPRRVGRTNLQSDALRSRRLGRNFAVRCLRPRLRYLLSRQPKPLDVKLDGIVHFPLDFRARATGGDKYKVDVRFRRYILSPCLTDGMPRSCRRSLAVPTCTSCSERGRRASPRC
jgi:hypothetical protein